MAVSSLTPIVYLAGHPRFSLSVWSECKASPRPGRALNTLLGVLMHESELSTVPRLLLLAPASIIAPRTFRSAGVATIWRRV